MTNVVYRYLGYGVTDSNGVAKLDHDENGDALTHSYTGVGAGEIDVLASFDNPVSSGSIVSEPFEVLDCVKYDKGILNDPDTHDIYSNTTTDALTRTSEYTMLKEVTSGTDVRTEITSLPSEFTMDLDFYQADGATGNGILNLYDSNDTYLTYFSISGISASVGAWLRLRLTATENSVIITDLDNPSHTQTRTFTGSASKLRLLTGGGITELRWKNVKIYP